MEKKTFRFIKNILFPVKSTIEIGPDGVTNKGKYVAWKDMVSCSYSITSINGSMNYSIYYEDNQGGNHRLNFAVALTGKKSKKAMFAEIYELFHQGFYAHIIHPKAQEIVKSIERGQEETIAGVVINSTGVTVPKVMKKKVKIFIPKEHVQMVHRDGSGGFDVQSSENPKDRGFFQYAIGEVRILWAVLEMLYPQHGAVDSPKDASAPTSATVTPTD